MPVRPRSRQTLNLAMQVLKPGCLRKPWAPQREKQGKSTEAPAQQSSGTIWDVEKTLFTNRLSCVLDSLLLTNLFWHQVHLWLVLKDGFIAYSLSSSTSVQSFIDTLYRTVPAYFHPWFFSETAGCSHVLITYIAFNSHSVYCCVSFVNDQRELYFHTF